MYKANNGLQCTQVAGGKRGFKVGLIQTQKAMGANGTDPTIMKHYVELENASEYDSSPALIQMPSGANVIDVCQGLYQTEMELATAMVAGVVEVNILSNTLNMYDDYSTQFIGSTTLLKAYNAATGNEITVTSVGAGTTIAKSFKITLSTADADYTAVPSLGLIRLEITSPSALATAGVVGFSECIFNVTKP